MGELEVVSMEEAIWKVLRIIGHDGIKMEWK